MLSCILNPDGMMKYSAPLNYLNTYICALEVLSLVLLSLKSNYLHSTTVQPVVVIILLTPKSMPPKRGSLGWFHEISMSANPRNAANYQDKRNPKRTRALHDGRSRLCAIIGNRRYLNKFAK